MGSAPRNTARITVLADRALAHDARAQRVALAAAGAGYRVTLLGRADDGPVPRLPGVDIRTVPVAETLHRHRMRRPRPGLRWPLAYRSEEAFLCSRDRIVVRSLLLETRAAELGIEYRPFPRHTVARAVHTVARARLSFRRAWTAVRSAQFRAAVRHRTAPDGLLDNASTALTRLLLARRAWRRLDPLLLDLEAAYGPVLDGQRPDLVHARGHRTLGVAVRAALRAEAAGRAVKVVWDADECAAVPSTPSRRAAAARDADERAHAAEADAVVAVSEAYAERLRACHRLPAAPVVVLNAPFFDAGSARRGGGVREACGIGPEVPLLVHSGAVSPERGLLTVVEALPKLYDLHAAFVVPHSDASYVHTLIERAAELGVASRLHVLPYVPPGDVPGFLASADIGVVPVHHLPHHEVTLAARYLEYAHARLPVVVSDVRAMAAATLELGNGEVFRARDTADFVRAVGAVLTNERRYRKAYERSDTLRHWSWQVQSVPLLDVYARLLGTRR
ncbi:glycosyltransferase [Streptomyces sp. RB6PN25]|uniref:D-inositol 3-phosphate glycosyltransferase n=1 Tax=Streptomyces humicola TaxID=2953240 RepID=A0ABT1PZG1_9ACTN|nr:glycosyltransferase [Streptomyces humicola]MCQ4082523.1 glycosyltransferase [Streptomyces humicola]